MPITLTRRIVVLLILFFSLQEANGQFFHPKLHRINREIGGQVLDFTRNHGCDRRIWSQSLCEKRDMYVYLPPGYDPSRRYPLMIWLHGIAADEQQFIESAVPTVDKAIRCGQLAPLIIAIPDGTRFGTQKAMETHTAFQNSRLGRFEDFISCDVWNFMVTNFRIRPERQSHILAGVSLGGGAAYHHAIKFRDRFGVVLGIYPPLNTRWMDCHGNYRGNFDPCCWDWRTDVRKGCEPVGRFFGLIKVPLRRFVYPLYGRGDDAIIEVSKNNPIEMMDRLNLQPGQLEMFVAYGKKDNFNLDAQIESFVFRARQRSIPMTVICDPNGRHNLRTAKSFFPAAIRWLDERIRPYSPAMTCPNCFTTTPTMPMITHDGHEE